MPVFTNMQPVRAFACLRATVLRPARFAPRPRLHAGVRPACACQAAALGRQADFPSSSAHDGSPRALLKGDTYEHIIAATMIAADQPAGSVIPVETFHLSAAGLFGLIPFETQIVGSQRNSCPQPTQTGTMLRSPTGDECFYAADPSIM